MKRLHESHVLPFGSGSKVGSKIGSSNCHLAQTTLKDHFRIVKPRLNTQNGNCGSENKGTSLVGRSGPAGTHQLKQGQCPVTATGPTSAPRKPLQELLPAVQLLLHKPLSPRARHTPCSEGSLSRTIVLADSIMASSITTSTAIAPAVSEGAVSLSIYSSEAAEGDDAGTGSHSCQAAPAVALIAKANGPARHGTAAAAAAATPKAIMLSSSPFSCRAFFATPAAPVVPPSHDTAAGEVTSSRMLSPQLCSEHATSAITASAGRCVTWGAVVSDTASVQQEYSTGSLASWLPAGCSSLSHGNSLEGEDDYADEAVSKGIHLCTAETAAQPAVAAASHMLYPVASTVPLPQQQGDSRVQDRVETPKAALAATAAGEALAVAHKIIASRPASDCSPSTVASHLGNADYGQPLQSFHAGFALQVRYQSRDEELVYGMAYEAEAQEDDGLNPEE